MIYLLILPLLFYYQTVLEASIKQAAILRKHKQVDMKELKSAENQSRTLNQIITLNFGLRNAAIACSSASIAPPAATAIKSAAKVMATLQDLLLRKLRISFLAESIKKIQQHRHLANTRRGRPQGPCGIPGPIHFNRNSSGFVLFEKNSKSGHCIKSATFSRPKWHFCRLEAVL